jgi:hypothetical protein
MAQTHLEKSSLKDRLVEEVRRLLAIATYLTVFFWVFRLYTSLILEELHINYFAYGLTIVKALVLAKIILAGDVLGIGAKFRDRPLIVATLYNTVVFALFALASEIAEHLILGAVLHGLGPAAVFSEILAKGWANLAGMTLVVFVAFIPFFAFREVERVLGEGTLFELFFTRNRRNGLGAIAAGSER